MSDPKVQSVPSTANFLFPYILVLLAIRLLIDTVVKYYQWGYNGESYAGILAFFFQAICIVIAVLQYKKKSDYSFTVLSGVKISIGLMSVVGLLFSFYIFYIHNNYIDPSYQQRIHQEFITHLKIANPQMDTTVVEGKAPNAVLGFPLWVLKYIFIGAVVGIPTSIFSFNAMQNKRQAELRSSGNLSS